MENQVSQSGIRKYTILVFVFVLSLVVMGVSFSYAFFTASISGTGDISSTTAAHLNVTSTLNEQEALVVTDLALIGENEYTTKTTPVEFSITNNDQTTLSQNEEAPAEGKDQTPSNVNAKYVVKIVEMKLSKNLFSKYFKWALVQDNGESGSKVLANGNFAGNTDEHPEGTDINVTVDEEGNRTISETDMVNVGTKELMAENEAILLKVGETHQLKFYLWLENDDKVDQLYLTDGQFEGKLSIEAVATHDNGSAEVAP